MGIDCRDVSQIIHLGQSDDVESYIQETGRAGRNGELTYCTLLKTKQWKRYITDDNMIDYLENNSICRRSITWMGMRGFCQLHNAVTFATL